MTKPKDVVGGFDATHCSTAIQVLRILRNGLKKDAKTAKERADLMTGYIRSQWLVKASTLVEVIELVDLMIETIPTKDPYADCKSFDEVCKVFIEEDSEMRKFFGKDKIKKWTLKRNVFVRGSQRLVEYTVTDENGKPVCARNNQRDAVVSALRIAAETNRGAVEVVGE